MSRPATLPPFFVIFVLSWMTCLSTRGQGSSELVVEQPPGTPISTGAYSHHYYPDTFVGASSSLTFRIRNTSAQPVDLQPSFSSSTGDFTITTPPAGTVPGLGSTTMVVTFTPTVRQIRWAYLVIGYTRGGNTGTLPQIYLRGKGLDSVFSFTASVYTAVQGDTKVQIGVRRTSPQYARTLTVTSSRIDVSEATPLTPAVEGLDYDPPDTEADPGFEVAFAAGQVEQTFSLTLLPRPAMAKKHLNMVFYFVDYSAEPYPEMRIAEVRILGEDKVKPTLSITSPAAGSKISSVPAMNVTGWAGDSMWIDRVEVRLNGNPAGLATLQVPPLPEYSFTAATPVSTAFIAQIVPSDGANTLDLTAYDVRGNSTTVTRSFNFTRREILRFYEPGYSDDNGKTISVGSLAMRVTPATAASAPVKDADDPRIQVAQVEVGALVKLVATAKKGWVFREWSCDSHPELALNVLGDAVTFIMPDAMPLICAEFNPTPFAPEPGETTNISGLLPDIAVSSGYPVEELGHLTGTLTSAGSFSGKLLMAGKSMPVVASVYVGTPAVFTVGGQKRPFFPLPGGRELRLDAGGMPLRALVSGPGGVDELAHDCYRAVFSATKKVPALLLNSSTKGTYTMATHLGWRGGTNDGAVYPQGHSYATIGLSNTGTVTLAGVLADNTPITASMPLLYGEHAHLFIQLPTPGGTTKNSLVLSRLMFYAEPGLEAYITGEMQWNRARAVSPKVLLYPEGWPQGMSMDIAGGLYDASMNVQTALGLDPPSVVAPGNAMLGFTAGTLTAPVTVTNFNINKNAVVKLPASDGSFTLIVSPATGVFTGTFTPNWASPTKTKPTFRGVIHKHSGEQIGAGFFISDSLSITTLPQGGAVSLQRP